MTEACELGVRAAAERIRTGELRPSQLLESCLDRIRAREPLVQAWEILDIDGARAQAKELDDRVPLGPLHGLPVGVKDIIDVAGLATRCGSPARAGAAAAARDAWIVGRLREAGAVILGKTVTTEFAYFTPGKTRNPHDLARTPGGSSSGSAAAVADHMVPLALGTQTAASTTRPAAYCGVAGLVNPPALLPDDGVYGLSATLDSLGLIGRSVDDLRLAATALFAPSDPEDPVRAPTLLVCDAAQFGELETSMSAALEDSVERLLGGGVRIDRLQRETVPTSLVAAHITIMAVEAAQSSAIARAGSVSESLQALLDNGRTTSEQDYRAAIAQARLHRDAVLGHLRGYDAVLTPAAPGAAPVGTGTGNPVFSRPWQAMGLPSVTIPGPRDCSGMPLGLQLIGRPDAVPDLLAVAAWIEAALASDVTD